MNLFLPIFVTLLAPRIPIAVVVDSAKTYRYVSAIGQEAEVPAGSVAKSVNYSHMLYLGDRIYFDGEIYIWKLRKDQNYLVEPLFNVPMAEGVSPTNDYAAVSDYAGPRTSTSGLEQYGTAGGAVGADRIPSMGATVRLQNVYLRDKSAAGSTVTIRAGRETDAPIISRSNMSSQGVLDSQLEAGAVIEAYRQYLRHPKDDVKRILRSEGLDASIKIGKRRPILIKLVDDDRTVIAREYGWFTGIGRKQAADPKKEIYLSWILRTAYLRNEIARERRESDLAKIGKLVWRNPRSPEWLKSKVPKP